jgi:DNA primase catalytic core
MEAERVDFPQALAMLAERAHIPMPEYHGQRSPEEARLYEEGKNLLYRLNEFAARFFEEQLWTEAGGQARAYLEGRGISRETAEAFRLGFAPDSWDALGTELSRRKAADRHVVAAGLAVERRDGTGVYDRFRNRLMFPIVDTSNRCVGFGARALSDADNPKYLNSPETPVFSKSRLLFGLAQARESMGDERRVLLMEGYTDVIMAVQKGFPGAAATLGTSLTREHIRLLRRFADEVMVLFDSDSAGQSATERGLDLFFEEEFPARVAVLEEGLDPCDYLVKRGPESFAERLALAMDLFDFKLRAIKIRHDLSTVHGQAAAMSDIVDSVANVRNPIMAETMRRRASEALKLSEERLLAEFTRRAYGGSPVRDKYGTDLAYRGPRARRERSAWSEDPESLSGRLTRRQKAEQALVRALLAYPPAFVEAGRDLDGFSGITDPAAAELLSTAAKVYDDLGELNLEELATSLNRADAVALVADFASQAEKYRPSDPAGSVFRVLVDLRRIDLEEELKRLNEEIRAADSDRQVVIADRIAEIKRELQQVGRRPASVAQEEVPEG